MGWDPLTESGPAIVCVGYMRTEHDTDFRGWGHLERKVYLSQKVKPTESVPRIAVRSSCGSAGWPPGTGPMYHVSG